MMELKRYYLKQELEQLPKETRSKLQAIDFVCQLNASDRHELAKRRDRVGSKFLILIFNWSEATDWIWYNIGRLTLEILNCVRSRSPRP